MNARGRAIRRGAAVLLLLAAAACGPLPARDVGAQLFADPRLSDSASNAVSCQTCHSMGGDDGRILPGHDLAGAVARPSFWGGYATDLLSATNHCIRFFMRGVPMQADDPRGRALYEYLWSQRSGVIEALPLTIVENITTVPRGERARGQQVWEAACASCHGAPSTGEGRNSPLASRVPDDSKEFAASSGFPLDVVVVEKVRHGAFFGIGGTMPPFSRERLSEEDLGALLAFLGL